MATCVLHMTAVSELSRWGLHPSSLYNTFSSSMDIDNLRTYQKELHSFCEDQHSPHYYLTTKLVKGSF